MYTFNEIELIVIIRNFTSRYSCYVVKIIKMINLPGDPEGP